MRDRIHELRVADLRLGARVVGIEEGDGWVQATYVDGSHNEHVVRGKFLVGADGKTGFTRKQYLEAKGIKMGNSLIAPYEETWVALNWRMSLPTPKTHPNFPLWQLGYTPQQVYDAFFPANFRFLCNPFRPSVCGRFGLDDDRLWRFEFVVRHGEDPAEMASPTMMAEVVHPYITHPGSRYGLPVKNIVYPIDCIEVLRCRPFFFSARSCNKWALGRVILCGDAAHVFPPFGGQGIASGFRDAISIAWRLYIATRQPLSSSARFGRLFEGWYLERKQQLDKSLQSTVENGTYVTESSAIKVFIRDWYLWLIQQVPSWRHWLELGNRRDGMVQYQWDEGAGMAFLPTIAGGRNLPQVYVTSINTAVQPPKVLFSDDVLFAPQKKGLFQLAVLLQSPNDAMTIDQGLAGLQQASHGALREDEATLFLNSTETPAVDLKERPMYRLATGAEFASTPLCAGRPEPVGYDPCRMSKEVGYKKFVILRPDRFVFAACDTVKELHVAAARVGSLFMNGEL